MNGVVKMLKTDQIIKEYNEFMVEKLKYGGPRYVSDLEKYGERLNRLDGTLNLNNNFFEYESFLNFREAIAAVYPKTKSLSDNDLLNLSTKSQNYGEINENLRGKFLNNKGESAEHNFRTHIQAYLRFLYVKDGGEILDPAKWESTRQESSKKNGINSIVKDGSEKKILEHQKISFGAPGTGKSFKINNDAIVEFPGRHERVTFHPNMSYGQFVGIFKPFPLKDKPSKITYKFVSGVLIKQLVKALLDPDEKYLIIIEEINRANVSAVFGDMFQLLDRKSDGESEYPITISEDLKLHFEMDYNEEEVSKLKGIFGEDFENGLQFPKNFYIWATMNSADQGVMPMDTAFKRRWSMEYVGVDSGAENIPFGAMVKDTEWDKVRRTLNEMLIGLGVPEDKLMGPFFISKAALEAGDISEEFKNKVISYIFDDAAKTKRDKFFNVDKKDMIFSKILEKFDNDGLSIFVGFDTQANSEEKNDEE